VQALLASWRYALTNALLMAFIAALAHGGWPIWAVLGLSVLIGGALDEAVGDDHERLGSRGQLFVDANLYATLPLLMIMSSLLLGLIASGGSPARLMQPPSGTLPVQASATLIAAVIGTGYFYALAGVTVAHELTHRVASPLALVWARLLLAFTLNPTFETYHVHGHHRNVCTYDDPATARRGEYVLAFVVRTVVCQSIDGWRLEAERLRRKRLSTWSWQNRVLGGIFCSLTILAAAALVAGLAGSIAFLAAAIFGRTIHEMVNYVQHYGIVRANGSPIDSRHAWDSCRLVSSALFYNLPRHADHHMFASKRSWELDALADSPKLPHGYQTMSLISLYPPWWHKVIDPLLADWDMRLADDVERSLVRERGWTIGRAGAQARASELAKLDRMT